MKARRSMFLPAAILLSMSFICSTAVAAPVESIKQESSDEELILDEVTPPVSAPVKKVETVKSAAEIPAAQEAKQPAVTAEDEDLILDDKEELIIPAEKPVVKKSDSGSDTLKPGQSGQVTPSAESQVSPGQKTADTLNSPAVQSQVTNKPAPVVIPAVEPVIEKTQSINFARNLKEYKSPKLAMILSLLIPGAGQAYTKNYLKTAMFGAVEAGLIVTSVAYSIRGRDMKDGAYEFAKKHFDMDDAVNYYRTLRLKLEEVRDSAGTAEVMEKLFMDSTALMEYAVHKGPEFYSALYNSSRLAPGWDDNEPALAEILNASKGDTIYGGQSGDAYVRLDDSIFYKVDKVDTTSGRRILREILGYSQNQKSYDSRVSEANFQYRISNGLMYILIVNHLVSAIDAGIGAKAYNDRMLGKESFWDRVEIKDRLVNTGSETVPGITLRVKF